MKIAGFSFVRNGFDYGVPFIESIQSILPICDEFVIAVGDSNDGTREAIEAIQSDKIKIIDTVWDMHLRKGGKVFAQQTNLALDAIHADWAFHIQSDEVMHEKDLPLIKANIEQYNEDKNVDGFLFPFLHFWGGYDHIRNTRRVHQHEIRIVRNHIGVRSYRDSQGFRKFRSFDNYANGEEKGTKLNVKLIDAKVFHYTGIRSPKAFINKAKMFNSHYDDPEAVAKRFEQMQYNIHSVDRTTLYHGDHPKVMMEKVHAQDWEYAYDKSKSVWKWKDRIIQPVEDLLGFKFGEYKNYNRI
ncbi:MAG: hypothetical protein RLZ56_512 [Bacteroidota bacterium]|jgi:hypothetical protein